MAEPLFNPATFSPEQANMLTNVPGKSLAETNTPEQISNAQNFIKTEQGSGIVSDTSKIQTDVNNMGNDITRGLAQYGINPPGSLIKDSIYNANQGLLDTGRENLKSTYEATKANTEAANLASEEALKAAGEKAVSQAEGRTRIGGFMTSQEAGDIIALEKKNALDLATLKSQHQANLIAAKNAYDNGDYQLAKEKLTLAQDTQKQIDTQNQNYFNDVIKYNSLNTPLTQANKAVQKWALDSMTKYPSGFTDLNPAQIVALTPKDIQNRILNSSEYKSEISGRGNVFAGKTPPKTSPQSNEEQKILKAINSDISTAGNTMLKQGTTREQIIRQLQAKYPQVNSDDIAKKIYETYPDNWENQ